MKKQLVKEKPEVVDKVLVPSESIPGDYHEVRLYKDGTIDCQCVGFNLYKVKECKHIKLARKLWKK